MKTKALLISVLSALVFSCSPDSGDTREEAKDVVFEFEQKDKTAMVDDNFDLFTLIKQKNVTRGDVLFNTDNPNIVKLNGSNLVTLKEGETFITAKLNASNQQTRMKLTIKAQKLNFTQEAIQIVTGMTYDLSKILETANIPLDQLTWVSSDEETVSVNANGLAKSLRLGQVKIVVYIKGKNIKSEIKVTVMRNEIEDVIFDSNTIEIRAMENITIPYKTIPEGADVKDLQWRILGDSRIRVIGPGILYSDQLQESTLAVIMPNGKVKKVNIKVVCKGVLDIKTPYGTDIDIFEGHKGKIDLMLLPLGEPYSEVEFTTNNSIIAVDQDGVIYSQVGKSGVANVTVKSKVNPSVKVVFRIQVRSFSEYVYTDINIDIIKNDQDTYSGEGNIAVWIMGMEPVEVSKFILYDGYKNVIYSDLNRYSLDKNYSIDFNRLYKPYIEYVLHYKGQEGKKIVELKTPVYNTKGMIIKYE